jgi:excisionase family DNA binding protein
MRATTSRHQEHQTDAPPLGLAINAAAVSVGVGRWSIYAAINSGALRAVKIGSRTIILESDLKTWMAQLPSYTVGGRS